MYMGKNGDNIMDAMTKAMMPKIRDADNRKYAVAINVAMKDILLMWFKLMMVMKSKEYQSDEVCRKFEENAVALNKAINKLIMNPPVTGCELKYSKQLKSHLLFDWAIFEFLMIW